jgi:hypothetical protein
MALLDPSKLPADTEVAKKLIDTEAQSETQRINTGLLGKLFGNKESAPINIIGFVLLILIAYLILFSFCGKDTEILTRKDVLTFILPIITSLVGFFIGNKSKKD